MIANGSTSPLDAEEAGPLGAGNVSGHNAPGESREKGRGPGPAPLASKHGRMNLPNDVARCPGADAPYCETCLRRQSDPTQRVIYGWIKPPKVDGWVCDYLIQPRDKALAP